MKSNKTEFSEGIRDGIPIMLGYFAVAFTLGITARQAGLNPLSAGIASLLLNASAGEFAGFTLMAAGASLIEVALMEAVANARYFLMSCSLSQKIDPKAPLWQRLIVAYDVTDEIFGISISRPGKLNPYYTFGAIVVAAPGWSIGTYLGVFMGNVLPSNIVSALSIGLYGMFIAIIIPPARANKKILVVVVVSMIVSATVSLAPVLKGLSSGTVTLILTIGLSALAALIFPLKEDADEV